MFELFYWGGIPWMTVLTLIMLALLLAAWKAPAWVKEIGIIALVVGVIAFLVGFYIAAGSIEKMCAMCVLEKEAGNSTYLEMAKFFELRRLNPIWGGVRVALIAPTYGFFIYLASLIIRIIQKPKI